jgi:hypothetical protein
LEVDYIIFAGHSKRSGGPKMVLVAPATKLPGELLSGVFYENSYQSGTTDKQKLTF